MGPLHCPLCIALAVLSLLRTASQALLLWRLLVGRLPAAPAGGRRPGTALQAAIG